MTDLFTGGSLQNGRRKRRNRKLHTQPWLMMESSEV